MVFSITQNFLKGYDIMNENSERNNDSVLGILLSAMGLLSFVLGFVLGVCVTKKLSGKCCGSRKNCKDFDADEYVRSLNLEEN